MKKETNVFEAPGASKGGKKMKIDKKKTMTFIKNVAFIFIGCIFLAIGVNLFLAPNKISSGGVSSIGTVLLHLFDIRMSLTNIVANAVLFVLGFRYLGKESIIKSAIGILSLTLWLEVTSYLPVYTENILAATVAGGLFIGLGLGLVVRQSASTGGTDFAALLIRRKLPHISVAHIILALDCSVILISGIVFRSVTVTVFSVVSMFIASMVTDAIVTIGNKAKAVRIFSNKSEEISKVIMDKFGRGLSGIHCKGMYSGEEKLMLLSIVSPKELPHLIKEIKTIDPTAFLVISDAREVLGEGFKTHWDYD